MATTYLPGAVRLANPSRRAFIGTAGFALPLAVAGGATAAHAADAPSDPMWPALVADFRAKHAVWATTVDSDEGADDEFDRALLSLPPEPQEPSSGLPDDLSDMTIAQIKASGASPAAWAQYETDHAAWAEQRNALRRKICGPATAKYDAAFDAFEAAMKALAAYRVINLSDLAEKIEIIAADHDGAEIPQKYLAEVLADVRHLARRMA